MFTLDAPEGLSREVDRWRPKTPVKTAVLIVVAGVAPQPSSVPLAR
jgi:hypothetical protein